MVLPEVVNASKPDAVGISTAGFKWGTVDAKLNPAAAPAANGPAPSGVIPPTEKPPPLGILERFKGQFAGKGYNMIFRPHSAASPTPFLNQAGMKEFENKPVPEKVDAKFQKTFDTR